MVAKGGIDLLLIAPTSTTALVAPLKAISDKGIPIITVDTYLGDGDYSKASDYSFPLAYIGTDNKLGGKQVAEHLAKLIGEKGKVYVVNTNPDTSSVVDRGNGFKEGIAEFPNVQLVGMDWCMDNQQKAMELTTAALQKNPDIVGIFGVNVFSAQGAAQAVKNAGLVGRRENRLLGRDPDPDRRAESRETSTLSSRSSLPRSAPSASTPPISTSAEGPPKKVIPGFEFFTKANVTNPDMQQYIYSK